MGLSDQLPQPGDVLTWENGRLHVVDGKRIDKVLATPLVPAENTHAEPD